MTRQSVSSSNIASVGFSDGTLEVEFVSGAVWAYDHVPESEYHALLQADSVGSYFASNIRGQYDGHPAEQAS